MLKNLFLKTKYEDYIPRPHHILYAVVVMSFGYALLLEYDWMVLGLFVFIVGIIYAFVVCWGIAWRGPIAYWEQIERTIQVMLKINNPDIWHAMGFKELPKTVIIQERRVDNFGQFQGMTMTKAPIDPAEMNRLANTVLMSKSLDFTEELYRNKVTNWRKVAKEFKEKGWAAPKNKKNVRGGTVLTHKGLQIMYEYADESVVRMVKKEMNGEKDATEK